MKTIGAAKFKAECLGLMDEVESRGTHFVITKKGRPVARLVPVETPEENAENPLDFLYVGGGKIVGDIIAPIVPPEDYEAFK